MNEGIYFSFYFLCVIFLSLMTLQVTAKPDIKSLHITSDVKYRFSTTLVTSIVANNDNTSVEARFEVTLPDAAFITDFVMEIGGQFYRGEIDEKRKAKKKYEKAKKKGQSAGHIAQKPRHTNRFKVDVNVAAESQITFNLTYQELLERVYGEYEHIIYIDPGQIVPDFQINVAIQESRKINKVSVPPLRNDIIQDRSIEEGTNALVTIDRPTSNSAVIHYAPSVEDQKKQSDEGISGLFVVEYDVERKSDAGEIMVVDGYFVHYFAPDGMDPIPKDVFFILDVSGSMSGRKIAQQREALDKIVQDLHEGDTFNIMQFSSNPQMWQPALVPATNANKEKARLYSKTMKARGSTGINRALMEGIDFLNKAKKNTNRMQLIVFLTDGMADNSRGFILNNVEEANTAGISIFSLAFGKNADYTFVKKLALNNKGIARKIFEDSDASLQIKDFYDEISASALQNVTFQYLGNNENIAENATQLNFNAFFNGKELVIAGKLSEDDVKTVSLVVTGNGNDGPVELTLDADLEGSIPELTKPGDYEKITERIWAYLTIKRMLEDAIGTDDADEKKELNNRALELALKYKFVTPLTSMVVTKPEEKDVGALGGDEDDELALAKGGGGSARTQSLGVLAGNPSGPLALRPPYGGSTGGGGGGDPHFIVRIKGLELPICFNIGAHEGDVLRMLEDPKLGLMLHAGIVKSTVKNNHGEFKTFIGNFKLTTPLARIQISPYKIIFNQAALSWDDHQVFKMNGVNIKIKKYGRHDRVMTIDLENDVILRIRRHMKEDTLMAVSYLNMFIDKEIGLSPLATGILGELVHKTTRLMKVTEDKNGRLHGHFREDGDGHTYKFYSTMDKRSDLITGKMIECWNTHMLGKGLLENKLEEYYVDKHQLTSIS